MSQLDHIEKKLVIVPVIPINPKTALTPFKFLKIKYEDV